MNKKLILYYVTIFFISLLSEFENTDSFAQIDSSSVKTVIETIADTTQNAIETVIDTTQNAIQTKTEKNQKTLQTENKENSSLTDDVGLESLRNIFKFGKIIASLIVLLGGFYLLKIITKILQFFAEKSTRSRISFKGTIPIVRLLGWTLIIYLIVGVIMKPPFGALIALSASLGIAIGLAAQDLIKNIFGGIMILFDRPFQVGDKIRVGDNYGEVISIGLRSTRIVTADDSRVIIPNSDIMNQAVSNSNSGEPNCQVVAEVFLPIDIDTVAVRDIALEVARVSKFIYLNKPINVLFFNEIKEKRSFLKMRLKAYVLDIRYEFDFKSEMTELIIRELIKDRILKREDVS